MRPYLQHGRRHAATGSDPIPGLAASGLSWAYQATPAHVTVGTSTNVIVAQTTATGFFTNDTASFSQGVASGKYGIKVDASTGLYLTLATFQPYTAIAAGVDYGVNIANANDPTESGLYMLPVRRLAVSGEAVDAQTLTWASLGTQDAGPAAGPMIFQAENHNSVASYAAFISILCIQLDSSQSTYVG